MPDNSAIRKIMSALDTLGVGGFTRADSADIARCLREVSYPVADMIREGPGQVTITFDGVRHLVKGETPSRTWCRRVV